MRCLLPTILWLLALPVAAQQLTHVCASEAQPAARLACYDKAFPPSQEVIEAATEQAQADFGLNKPRDPLRNPGQTVEQADPDRVQGLVSRVDHGGNGQRSFHLENGQVWTQTDSTSSGHVQPGDTVQVRKGMLSGYLLVMPNGVVVRVRRTR